MGLRLKNLKILPCSVYQQGLYCFANTVWFSDRYRFNFISAWIVSATPLLIAGHVEACLFGDVFRLYVTRCIGACCWRTRTRVKSNLFLESCLLLCWLGNSMMMILRLKEGIRLFMDLIFIVFLVSCQETLLRPETMQMQASTRNNPKSLFTSGMIMILRYMVPWTVHGLLNPKEEQAPWVTMYQVGSNKTEEALKALVRGDAIVEGPCRRRKEGMVKRKSEMKGWLAHQIAFTFWKDASWLWKGHSKVTVCFWAVRVFC